MKRNKSCFYLPVRLTASLLVLLVTAFLAGCTEADVMDGDNPGEQSVGETVEATFSLQVMPGKTRLTRSVAFARRGPVVSDTVAMPPDTLHTRAGTEPGTPQERTISNVWVGQYDAVSGALLTRNYITPVPAGNKVTLKLVSSGKSRVRFVTNAGDLGTTASTAVRTEDGLKKYKFASTASDGKLPGNVSAMTGLWEGAIPSAGIAAGQARSVDLARVPAKLTFRYTIRRTDHFSFIPASINVRNVPSLSQVETPKGQLAGVQYSSYTFGLGAADLAKTIECYLPENMAGNGNAVASSKDRIGIGVTNPTCIELAGNAVWNGVNYDNVVIRFCPGDPDPAKMNNYDIERNSHYMMDITLDDLDITDKRITIGEIPPVGPIPDLPAAKGATQKVQITARPGQEWVFDLPTWLSAMLPDKTPGDSILVSAGSQLSYQGPASINFKVEESNPRAESREVTFPIVLDGVAGTTDHLTLIQEGATLIVPGGDMPLPVDLDATAGSVGTLSFTATKGLPWNVLFSSDSLDWSGTPELDNETTGEPETYTIVADYVNPSRNPRTRSITLRIGASVSDPAYDGLEKTIPVNQAGAVVQASAIPVPAAPQTNLTGTFTATPGLSWTAESNTPWIEITTPSGALTVAGDNTVAFSTTAINPNAVPRNGQITVTAGGQPDSPSDVISVQQAASEFRVTSPAAQIPQGGTGSVTGTITATAHLPWVITSTAGDAMTVTPASGSGSANLTFTATENKGRPRTGTFYVSVTGAEPARTVQIQVTQEGIQHMITIDQALADRYKEEMGSGLAAYPPFNYDNGVVTASGGDRPLGTNSSECTVETPYSIEVSKAQPSDYEYGPAIGQCGSLGEKWRVPTLIELFAMYQHKDVLEDIAGFVPFVTTGFYWSGSVYDGEPDSRSLFFFSDGDISSGSTANGNKHYVRCVRDM